MTLQLLTLHLMAAASLGAMATGQPLPSQLPGAAKASQETDKESADDGVQDAIDALRGGDVVTAKALVDQLLIEDRIRVATADLGEARPMAAMGAIDQALAVESLDRATRAKLLFLRGRAAFAAASTDSSKASLYEEALANFEQAAKDGAGVSAAFRASRAARLVGDPEAALELARAGARWVDAKEGRAEGLDLDQPFTRTWAEAAFSAYLAERSRVAASPASPATDGPAGVPDTPDPELAAKKTALFDETRAALERTIGSDATDTWAYRELANLHLWEGQAMDALVALESALAVAPNDEPTHTAFVTALGNQAERAARAAGGDDQGALDARFDTIIKRYAAFRESHPENALGFWYGGFESFYRALDAFERGATDPAPFAEAEALFKGCRERSANYAEPSRDYEILCRVGQGWCLYAAEDNDAAIERFFSAEELRPLAEAQATGRTGALDVRLPRGDGTDRLPSALAGLDFVTRRFLGDPMDTAALTKAASIGDRMFAARPENANLANNAGFLNRDAAVLWENEAKSLLRGGSASPDEPTTPQELERGRASRQRGQELMEKSYAAYQVAAALLPDDVRVVNDAGLVMAYYLRTDPESAEAYFLDAVKDGEPQLADPTLGEAEREALNEAWGDAHQNMGILEMTQRMRPKEARDWFAKALEIGPPSRSWIGSALIPQLDLWIETGERPQTLDALEAQTIWAHNPPE